MFLIDIWAYITIIPKHLLPNQTPIYQAEHKVVAANVLPILISRTVKNLPVPLEGKNIDIKSTLVARIKNQYAILGVLKLLKNPNILTEIIAKNTK